MLALGTILLDLLSHAQMCWYTDEKFLPLGPFQSSLKPSVPPRTQMHHGGPANSYKPETHPAFKLTGKDRGPRPLREIYLSAASISNRGLKLYGGHSPHLFCLFCGLSISVHSANPYASHECWENHGHLYKTPCILTSVKGVWVPLFQPRGWTMAKASLEGGPWTPLPLFIEE